MLYHEVSTPAASPCVLTVFVASLTASFTTSHAKIKSLYLLSAPIADKTKLRYYLRRLFPDMEFYKSYYPVVYKVKILIPFFVIYRMLRGAVFSGKRLAREAVMVWKEDR